MGLRLLPVPMLDALYIFGAQFAMIFLLVVQNLNVVGGHHLLAAITSAFLGCAGYYITGVIATAFAGGMGTLIWWAYIVAGPCAAITSMTLHPWISHYLGVKHENTK